MNKLADVAHEHLGESGPNDSCLQAVNRWAKEAGGKALPTDSVSAAVQLVSSRGAEYGWTYHEGLDGVQLGDVLRWARAHLNPSAADPNPEHVSVFSKRDSAGGMQSIGSGGPTGKVALQPQSGGFNPPATFRGYFRIQLQPAAPSKPAPAPSKPASKPASSGTITVAAGETLWALAQRHGTTVGAFLTANPPAADRRTQDFHITRPSLILKGQRLHLP